MSAETDGAERTALRWFKSSHSSEEGGECVEVALAPGLVHVRDSKAGADSPQLGVAEEAWGAFLRDL